MTLADEVRSVRALPSPEHARAIRRAAGVTQVRLAEEIGVTRATINRWESGERRPRGRLLLAYAEALAAIESVIR